MTSINKHVEDYLDYFLRLPIAPEYAVLIKGNWGVGKTRLIKKYIEMQVNEDEKPLYVSLYGMQTIKEIEESFFQQMHPVLGSKHMKFAGKILSGALKATLKLDGVDLSLGSTISGVDLSQYFGNVGNSLIVFDDLERCVIPLEDILGYINHFVEYQGLKVVVVANEDILLRQESEDCKYNNYIEYKEKIFGITLEVLPDFDDVFDSIIETISNEKLRKYISENSSTIKELFSLTEKNNFRILKRTIMVFDRLYSHLSTEIREKHEFVEQFLKLFFVLCFEHRLGNLDSGEIATILKGFFFLPDFESQNNLKKKIIKYEHLDILNEPLVDGEAFADFLTKGVLNIDVINKSIKENKFFYFKETPPWKKLWHYNELNDEEFNEHMKQVQTDFNNRAYDDVGVIICSEMVIT